MKLSDLERAGYVIAALKAGWWAEECDDGVNLIKGSKSCPDDFMGTDRRTTVGALVDAARRLKLANPFAGMALVPTEEAPHETQ